tara:strand:+ start:565 stop:1245 length:681 start_codon:yes stop_codon:yes gene_type:complete
MSTLKTGALRGTSGTADSVQLHASNQSVTFPGAVTITGALTSSTTSLGGLDGVTTGSGHVTISDGDLIIGTSGHGIDFSATSDGSGTDTSELLDDYEEGTWVPTAGGSDNYSTYNVSGTGTYTKVGRLITVSAVFNNVSLSTSAGGIIYFKGLPYVPGFDSDLGAAFKFYGVGTDSDRPIIVLYSSTGGHLGMNKSGDNNATQYVSVDEFKGTGKYFDFSMVYQTS